MDPHLEHWQPGAHLDMVEQLEHLQSEEQDLFIPMPLQHWFPLMLLEEQVPHLQSEEHVLFIPIPLQHWLPLMLDDEQVPHLQSDEQDLFFSMPPQQVLPIPPHCIFVVSTPT